MLRQLLRSLRWNPTSREQYCNIPARTRRVAASGVVMGVCSALGSRVWGGGWSVGLAGVVVVLPMERGRGGRWGDGGMGVLLNLGAGG